MIVYPRADMYAAEIHVTGGSELLVLREVKEAMLALRRCVEMKERQLKQQEARQQTGVGESTASPKASS